MRTAFIAVLCSALAGFSLTVTPVLAQQKTVKDCQQEWRTNQAANQAAGVTEKAYVAKCRADTAAAPAGTSAAAPATAPTKPLAQQKTVKECQHEWRANQAANQAAGVTEKAYVATCRATAAATPAATSTGVQAKPAATAPASAAPATPAPKRTSPSQASAVPTGANQFSNEGQAKAHCIGNDIVVWANLDSKIYHFGGSKDFGNTKHGAYMCEKDALAQGIRVAKNESHP